MRHNAMRMNVSVRSCSKTTVFNYSADSDRDQPLDTNIQLDVDDEAEQELQQQLNRTRRMALAAADVKKEEEAGGEAPLKGAQRLHMLMANIKDEPMDETGEGAKQQKGLMIDSVAEYTRHLGDQALAEEEERQTEHLREMLMHPVKHSDDEMDRADVKDDDDEDTVAIHRDRRDRWVMLQLCQPLI